MKRGTGAVPGALDTGEDVLPRLRLTAPDTDHYRLLATIGRAHRPIGARQLTRLSADDGRTLSEATINRILRATDAAGLTRSVDGKGRMLTEEGRRTLRLLELSQIRSEAVARALDIRTVKDLLDLLYSRRALEREAVRAAAKRATPEDIGRLEEVLEHNQQALAAGGSSRRGAHEFHRIIGEISANAILIVFSSVVFDPELDHLEQVLDIITAGHGTLATGMAEHRRIVEALRAGDPDRAERWMVRHLNRLIEETEQHAKTSVGGMIERLLAVNRNARGLA